MNFIPEDHSGGNNLPGTWDLRSTLGQQKSSRSFCNVEKVPKERHVEENTHSLSKEPILYSHRPHPPLCWFGPMFYHLAQLFSGEIKVNLVTTKASNPTLDLYFHFILLFPGSSPSKTLFLGLREHLILEFTGSGVGGKNIFRRWWSRPNMALRKIQGRCLPFPWFPTRGPQREHTSPPSSSPPLRPLPPISSCSVKKEPCST